MIKTIKKILTTASLLGLLLAPALAPVAISGTVNAQAAEINECLKQGSDLSATGINDTDGCNPTDNDGTAATTSVDRLIKTVINVFSLVVGVIAVVMIIIGGLKYITSGGDSGNVTGAKNTILYAIVGLIIVALAQVIVRFVLARASA